MLHLNKLLHIIYKEPAQRVTTNTATKETASNQATVDTKQFTPFSATAQPRTVYSVSSQKHHHYRNTHQRLILQ